MRAAFDSAVPESPPPSPDVIVGRVLRQVFLEREPGGTAGTGRQVFSRLILQVWTETLRNEELGRILREG